MSLPITIKSVSQLADVYLTLNHSIKSYVELYNLYKAHEKTLGKLTICQAMPSKKHSAVAKFLTFANVEYLLEIYYDPSIELFDKPITLDLLTMFESPTQLMARLDHTPYAIALMVQLGLTPDFAMIKHAMEFGNLNVLKFILDQQYNIYRNFASKAAIFSFCPTMEAKKRLFDFFIEYYNKDLKMTMEFLLIGIEIFGRSAVKSDIAITTFVVLELFVEKLREVTFPFTNCRKPKRQVMMDTFRNHVLESQYRMLTRFDNTKTSAAQQYSFYKSILY
jgi:hypothetical protein